MNQFKETHSPWCRIHWNPGSTTECWCASDIAVVAYRLGRGEGQNDLADLRRESDRREARYETLNADIKAERDAWRGRARILSVANRDQANVILRLTHEDFDD